MAVYQGIMLAVLVTILAVSSVQGQDFITPTERALRANLTKLVQYVVHPSAEPTMDLINYALVAGGQPKNQAERMAYLRMMKQIARGIPELVNQYSETDLDARITMRAMQYVQKQRKEAAAAATAVTNTGAISTASASNAAVNTGVSFTATDLNAAPNTGVISTAGEAYGTPIVPASVANTGAISTGSESYGTPAVPASVGVVQNDVSQYQLGVVPPLAATGPVAVQDLQHNTIIPAADGTISLEDVFKFINSQNLQNKANTQVVI